MVHDFDTQLELLAVARAVQSECLHPGCHAQRVGTGFPLAVDHADSYCEPHGDAL